MTANETAAYNAGTVAAVSGKNCPTYYTGNLAIAFRLGKLEALAAAGTITDDGRGWLAHDVAYFVDRAA
jgi:hypothetical protein